MVSKMLSKAHTKLIAGRRRAAIARTLSGILRDSGFEIESLLDVGCGNGAISSQLLKVHQGLIRVEGVDVVVPESTEISVSKYDGKTVPFGAGAFDAVLLCDVLHHIKDQAGIASVLLECARVARKLVVVKDHSIDSRFDRLFISFLDTIGNLNTGIAMPLTFLSRQQWKHLFQDASLETLIYKEAPFGIHPPIVRHFTEIPFWTRPYHFISVLAPRKSGHNMGMSGP